MGINKKEQINTFIFYLRKKAPVISFVSPWVSQISISNYISQSRQTKEKISIWTPHHAIDIYLLLYDIMHVISHLNLFLFLLKNKRRNI